MASFVSQLAGLVGDSFFRKKNENDSDEVSSVPFCPLPAILGQIFIYLIIIDYQRKDGLRHSGAEAKDVKIQFFTGIGVNR